MTDILTASLDAHIDDAITAALAEDVGSGDLTAALVPATQRARATIITRENGVLCGQPWVNGVFGRLDPRITIRWQAAEGARVAAGQVLCELEGLARPLLTGERTALNFLQTLSAVATATAAYVAAVEGTRARILDTRKTLPGLRLAQKYAVRVGGGTNHRLGLYDAILVKENHIIAAGSITAAIRTARQTAPKVLLEVEVENLGEAKEALGTGADRLLLDNFSLEDMRAAVALRERLAPGVTLEASGGVDLGTVRAIAETGVDFISIGSLTKNIRALDLSMRFTFSEGT